MSVHPTLMIAEAHEKQLAKEALNEMVTEWLDSGLMLSQADADEVVKHIAQKFDFIEKVK
jgi:predicted house-cleaning noncanonical NTP pyrophosphatase (MazG superfamily)